MPTEAPAPHPTATHAFLAINPRFCTPSKGRPLLACVDAQLIDELERFPWQAHHTGRVFRRAIDAGKTADQGKVVLDYHVLANVVLGLAGDVKVHPISGDHLDCRAINLTVDETTIRPAVPAGSTLVGLPGYQAALLHRIANAEVIARRFKTGRPAQLGAEDVRRLLDEITTDPLMARAPLSEIREHISATYRVVFSIGQISAILAGKSLRLDGYDYEKLRSVRPTPSETARRRRAALHPELAA